MDYIHRQCHLFSYYHSSYKYYTKFIIEDFDDWAEESINKDSLNILKECLKSLKSNRKTPIKIELLLNKNKKDAYEEVLDIVDEIKDEE